MKTSKKIIAIFALSSQLLCGCMTLADLDDRLREKEYEQFCELAEPHVQSFVDAMKTRNEESLSSLFCETVKKSDASFSSSVSDFYQFYQGEMVDHLKKGMSVWEEYKKDGEYYLFYAVFHFYIYTDVANYYVAYYGAVIDKFDEENEGIWSFNVRKFSDEEPEPMNWYDDEWLDGIHIYEEES